MLFDITEPCNGSTIDAKFTLNFWRLVMTKTTAQEVIDHSHAIPEPEGVEAFDEYLATQNYPSPLHTCH